MATFADIQTAVSKRLLDPNNVSISSADVADSINKSIAHWKFRRFWFNEVADTVTMTAQNAVLPVTGSYLVSTMDDDGFNIIDSDARYPLTKVSQAVYDGRVMANGYGRPEIYARVGQQYVTYPIPDKAYVVNRHYLKDYALLVSGSDTNDFTVNADVLIRNWTLANMSAEFRQDDKMEAYYRAAATDEYKNLGVMTGKSNGTGKLTISSTLL